MHYLTCKNKKAEKELNDILTSINAKSQPFELKLNYLNIPVTLLEPTDNNARIFNRILNLLGQSGYGTTQRTNSGGISKLNVFSDFSYQFCKGNNAAEIVITADSNLRIQFRSSIYTNEDTGEKLSGRKAFKNFQQLCEKHNINLEKYKCSEAEGLKAKEEIAKPWIKLEEDFEAFTGSDFVYENMHHVDIRSSYPAGLAETHPEFRPVIQELFDKRKDPEEGPKMKATLVYIIGFMQSKNINYCYAKLSRDAINKNDAKIRYLREELIKSGRQPILYNTDGIWYQGEVYHGYGEGDKLGQWHNDHTNCKMRIKSKGCYEYIEDGKYYPVVRARTNLDRLKDRTKWEWGDIFYCSEIYYRVTDFGIANVRGELY